MDNGIPNPDDHDNSKLDYNERGGSQLLPHEGEFKAGANPAGIASKIERRQAVSLPDQANKAREIDHQAIRDVRRRLRVFGSPKQPDSPRIKPYSVADSEVEEAKASQALKARENLNAFRGSLRDIMYDWPLDIGANAVNIYPRKEFDPETFVLEDKRFFVYPKVDYEGHQDSTTNQPVIDRLRSFKTNFTVNTEQPYNSDPNDKFFQRDAGSLNLEFDNGKVRSLSLEAKDNFNSISALAGEESQLARFLDRTSGRAQRDVSKVTIEFPENPESTPNIHLIHKGLVRRNVGETVLQFDPELNGYSTAHGILSAEEARGVIEGMYDLVPHQDIPLE